MEDMKKEFLSKLQRQNASLLTSSVEEEDNDESLGVPDLTILDPDMMGKNYITLTISKLLYKENAGAILNPILISNE